LDVGSQRRAKEIAVWSSKDEIKRFLTIREGVAYCDGSIAYDNLTASTKMRVDALLAQHPDFPKWTMGVPAAHKGKTAFVKASAWPDDIKGDPRFFDEGDPPTPEIPGLPVGSNKRNREWHFTNVPFTMDDTPTVPPAMPNALTKP
jgi:hypothetical protein